ncbi:spry domain protein [Ichthyophthirius multifiliis]|uniref:Spry domain protein n=1 Tax=Ichthyophthirius multifiliis TaxID=5932 RepID=G0QQ00_ICHMU|nr:spry domain protein [Ichthyophthirius multifiliis]EGR32707.1 spry domain protein [Ichthyophthirius multifiliis]|eukprot:XP_004036693.1 spry domain protein [Ichthyophthirius multifiliis]
MIILIQYVKKYTYNLFKKIKQELQWDSEVISKSIKIIKNNEIFLDSKEDVFKTAITKQSFNTGKHYWEIIPNSKTQKEFKVGVCLSNQFNIETAFCDFKIGYGYYTIGQLRFGSNQSGKQYGKKIKNEGVLGVFLNIDKGQLSFSLNGEYLGIAYECENLKKGPIYPAISLCSISGCKIQYLNIIPSIFL